MPLIVRGTFNVCDSELAVPLAFQFVSLGFKVPRWQLSIEVGACLLYADEGSAYLDFHHRVCVRVELRESANGIAGQFSAIRYWQSALIDALAAERLPKARDEIALEIGQPELAQMRVHAVGVVAH